MAGFEDLRWEVGEALRRRSKKTQRGLATAAANVASTLTKSERLKELLLTDQEASAASDRIFNRAEEAIKRADPSVGNTVELTESFAAFRELLNEIPGLRERVHQRMMQAAREQEAMEAARKAEEEEHLERRAEERREDRGETRGKTPEERRLEEARLEREKIFRKFFSNISGPASRMYAAYFILSNITSPEELNNFLADKPVNDRGTRNWGKGMTFRLAMSELYGNVFHIHNNEKVLFETMEVAPRAVSRIALGENAETVYAELRDRTLQLVPQMRDLVEEGKLRDSAELLKQLMETLGITSSEVDGLTGTGAAKNDDDDEEAAKEEEKKERTLDEALKYNEKELQYVTKLQDQINAFRGDVETLPNDVQGRRLNELRADIKKIDGAQKLVRNAKMLQERQERFFVRRRIVEQISRDKNKRDYLIIIEKEVDHFKNLTTLLRDSKKLLDIINHTIRKEGKAPEEAVVLATKKELNDKINAASQQTDRIIELVRMNIQIIQSEINDEDHEIVFHSKHTSRADRRKAEVKFRPEAEPNNYRYNSSGQGEFFSEQLGRAPSKHVPPEQLARSRSKEPQQPTTAPAEGPTPPPVRAKEPSGKPIPKVKIFPKVKN